MRKKTDFSGRLGPARDYARLVKRGLFSDNPVLRHFLGLAPLLGATASLKDGLLVSAVIFLMLTFAAGLSALLYTRTPALLRPAFPALTGALFLAPMLAAAQHFFPNVTASVGIFLPLCAVSGILFWQTEHFCLKRGLLSSLAHGAGNGLGFAAAALLLSALREIIGAGTLLGRALPGLSGFAVHFALLPPGAFLAAALLFAAVQHRRLRRAGLSGKAASADAGGQKRLREDAP